MEKDSALMDQKIYYEAVNSSQKNLYNQCHPNQNPNDVFHKNKTKKILKIVNLTRLQIAKIILKKENKVGGLTLSDFKTYYKVSVIKILYYQWYWHKDKHKDQVNRIQSPEINLCINGQAIFDQGAKTI